MWTGDLVCVGDPPALGSYLLGETVDRLNNDSRHYDVCAHIGSVKHRLTRLMRLLQFPVWRFISVTEFGLPVCDCVLAYTTWSREA